MSDEAIKAARADGQCGATRISDTVLFGHGELGDTTIILMTVAFLEGRDERERAKVEGAT